MCPESSKVWTSKRYGFEITLPEGWAAKSYEKPDGSRVADIYDTENHIPAIIGIDKWQGNCVDYIKTITDYVKQSSEVVIIKESSGPSWATIVYTAVVDGVLWQRYLYVIDINGVKMRFAGGTEKTKYEEYRPVFEKYAPTLKALKPEPIPQAVPDKPKPVPMPEDKPLIKKSGAFFSCIPTVFVLLLLSAAYILLLWSIKGAALDIPYKAGWIITHWDKISADTEICSEPFCFETNTIKKSAGLWRYSYCNQHRPELQRSRRATIGYLAYWIIILLLTVLLAAIFGLVVLIALQPVLFLLAATGIFPGLKPFYYLKPSTDKGNEAAGQLSILFVTFGIGGFLMAIAWVMYIYW